MTGHGDGRFFDQRNAKREQAQTFDMSTPERDEDRGRVREPSPRRRAVEKSDVGIQALVTTAEIGTQSDVMLPHMVPALWPSGLPYVLRITHRPFSNLDLMILMSVWSFSEEAGSKS